MALAGLIVWLATPGDCFGCTVQAQPPGCGANISSTTVHKGDKLDAWWNVLARREERLIHVYLGLNHNSGPGTANYTYQIAASGDWLPDAAEGGLTPASGSGTLGAVGTQAANDTIEIAIPYTEADTGDLTITATLASPDCPFNPSTLTTTVRLNDKGPTVWPVMPHTCPKAGEKPSLTFGIRNSTAAEQTYSVVAAAFNPYGGTGSDVFNLNGQGGEARLEPVTVKPGESKKIKIDCETFGYCLNGGENQVQLKVGPTAQGDTSFESIAASNVTIRAPDAKCPEARDWWFIMPPAIAAGLAGVAAIALAFSGCLVIAKISEHGDMIETGCFCCDYWWLVALASGLATVAFTLITY